jgi:hypothetical protein
MDVWSLCLYAIGVILPVSMGITLVMSPNWGNAAWFVGLLFLGWTAIGAARERRRRRRPAHER